MLRMNFAMLCRGQERYSADIEVLHFLALVIIRLDQTIEVHDGAVTNYDSLELDIFLIVIDLL